MAKIMFGGGVSEMRGSQAGNTFSRNRGGSYTRQRVTPLNPQSARQQSVRNSLLELSTAWGTVLTQSQRDAWTSFAASWPTTDVFGASIVLTGLQMYTRQNMTLLQAGLTRLDDPPADLDVESLLTMSIVADESSNNLVVTFTPTPVAATSHVQVFATPNLQPGISFAKNKLRLIHTSAAAGTSPITITTEYTDAFGSMVTGKKVIVQARIIDDATGAVSVPLQASAIVQA